jgi:hypothetical protein
MSSSVGLKGLRRALAGSTTTNATATVAAAARSLSSRLQCSAADTRERSQTVTAYYNQSAIDAAAAKVS